MKTPSRWATERSGPVLQGARRRIAVELDDAWREGYFTALVDMEKAILGGSERELYAWLQRSLAEAER